VADPRPDAGVDDAYPAPEDGADLEPDLVAGVVKPTVALLVDDRLPLGAVNCQASAGIRSPQSMYRQTASRLGAREIAVCPC
jgi:hypothetical protein